MPLSASVVDTQNLYWLLVGAGEGGGADAEAVGVLDPVPLFLAWLVAVLMRAQMSDVLGEKLTELSTAGRRIPLGWSFVRCCLASAALMPSPRPVRAANDVIRARPLKITVTATSHFCQSLNLIHKDEAMANPSSRIHHVGGDCESDDSANRSEHFRILYD